MWALLRPADVDRSADERIAENQLRPQAPALPARRHEKAPPTERVAPTRTPIALAPTSLPALGALPEAPIAIEPTAASEAASEPVERVAVEPRREEGEGDLRALDNGPFPSPAQVHLEEVGQRVRNLATVLRLDDDATRALTRIMADHVSSGRALWEEANIYGDTEIDEEEKDRLRENTLDAVRDDPSLGDELAPAIERVLPLLVRDPQTPLDPDQHQLIGITELRHLAGRE